ncbi:hypothetical protein NQK81_13185 [Amycolatopsis roodepoortensis]|uniref:hypothetical protein n=1 Tax=Amycolatopsis roodepoortensis TaxID=700274 RepID=UPI00214AB060|nr:hypothetical protein [Amycolatopsis roodepoortensis]UUV34358.1 hypothetical protein NQK81_13185 [Amycolatopsis roodepoortensis]
MRIRVEGTTAETERAAELLAEVFEVREVSSFYPNRGRSTLGRVYVDVEFGTSGRPVRATATRVDRVEHSGRQFESDRRRQLR